jgi:hypothetical protein
VQHSAGANCSRSARLERGAPGCAAGRCTQGRVRQVERGMRK